jgi:hypothetical protein
MELDGGDIKVFSALSVEDLDWILRGEELVIGVLVVVITRLMKY